MSTVNEINNNYKFLMQKIDKKIDECNECQKKMDQIKELLDLQKKSNKFSKKINIFIGLISAVVLGVNLASGGLVVSVIAGVILGLGFRGVYKALKNQEIIEAREKVVEQQTKNLFSYKTVWNTYKSFVNEKIDKLTDITFDKKQDKLSKEELDRIEQEYNKVALECKVAAIIQEQGVEL